MTTEGNVFGGKGFNPLDNIDEALSQDFGNWKVTDEGKLLYVGSAIAAPQKGEEYDPCELDFVHYMSKVWTDYKDCRDFFLAYLNALKTSGCRSLTIDITGNFESRFNK